MADAAEAQVGTEFILLAFLPAGGLLAAAGFLRLYAIRSETDLLEDDRAD